MNEFRFIKFFLILIFLSISNLLADSATKKVENGVEIKFTNLLNEAEELVVSMDFYLSIQDSNLLFQDMM